MNTSRAVHWLVGTTLLVSVACGGSQTQATEADLAATPGPESEGVLAPTQGFDPRRLQSREAPPTLLGTARIGRPENIRQRVVALGKLPNLPWPAVIDHMWDASGSGGSGSGDNGSGDNDLGPVIKAFANEIDFTMPIDGAIGLNPKSKEPEIAVAMRVRSVKTALDAARASGLAAIQVVPRLYVIQVAKGAKGPGGAQRIPPCLINGVAMNDQTLLVCARTPRVLEDYQGFLTGVLAPRPVTDDVHVSINAEPLRKFANESDLRKFEQHGVPMVVAQLSGGDSKLHAQLERIVRGLIRELFDVLEDADRLESSWKLVPGALDGSVSIPMRGTRSWVARYVQASVERNREPSDLFWQIPAETEAAGFQVAGQPALYRPILEDAAVLLGAMTRMWELPAAARARIESLVTGLEKLDGAIVTAQGGMDPKAAKVLPMALSSLAQRWAITAIDREASDVKGFIDELVALLNDRDLRALLERRLDAATMSKLPKIKTGRAPGRYGRGARRYSMRIPRALVETLSDEPGKKARDINIELVLAPDKGRTWLVYGTDKRAAAAALREAKANSRPWAERAELAALRQPAAAGGFWSLRGLAASFQADLPVEVTKLPHQGATPIPYRIHTHADGPRIQFALHVPDAVIEDVVALDRGSKGSESVLQPK